MELILPISGLACLAVLFVVAPRIAITLVCLPFVVWAVASIAFAVQVSLR